MAAPQIVIADLIRNPAPPVVIADSDPQSMPSVNQIYNVALGDRTTLNQLYAQIKANLLPHYPHLQTAAPVYRDFRDGDVRHSLADISKAASLLGYTPRSASGRGWNSQWPGISGRSSPSKLSSRR